MLVPTGRNRPVVPWFLERVASFDAGPHRFFSKPFLSSIYESESFVEDAGTVGSVAAPAWDGEYRDPSCEFLSCRRASLPNARSMVGRGLSKSWLLLRVFLR